MPPHIRPEYPSGPCAILPNLSFEGNQPEHSPERHNCVPVQFTPRFSHWISLQMLQPSVGLMVLAFHSLSAMRAPWLWCLKLLSSIFVIKCQPSHGEVYHLSHRSCYLGITYEISLSMPATLRLLCTSSRLAALVRVGPLSFNLLHARRHLHRVWHTLALLAGGSG